MSTERVRWKNWDTVRCVARECEMVVGVSAGPRILSSRRGAGPNLLHPVTADFRVGKVALASGEHVRHRQCWRLFAPIFTPCDWRAIGAQAGCISAASIARHAP